MAGQAEPQFTQDEGGITYQARVPLALRLVALFFALVALSVTIPFAAYTNWSAADWTVLVGIFGIVFPLFVAALFTMMGLAPGQRLRFDAARRMVTENLSGPLGRRQREFAFTAIGNAAVAMREPEDGKPYPVLMLGVAGRRPMEIGTFDDRAEAEFWRDRILTLVGAPA